MAKEHSAPSGRANHYRQVAVIIRAQIPIIRSAEARDELAALAAGYESRARRANEAKGD
jgi:hypothetical protein